MPNPFVRGGPANTSEKDATGRTPIPPVPESYEGFNQPYRGIETHGVEPTEKPALMPNYSEHAPITYEPEPDIENVVPVRVVNQQARFLRTARADTIVLAANQPVNVVGRDQSRTSLRIDNLDDTDTVYVGFAANAATWIGTFALAPGKSVELKTQDDVWVMATVADTNVTWLAEYEIPTND